MCSWARRAPTSSACSTPSGANAGSPCPSTSVNGTPGTYGSDAPCRTRSRSSAPGGNGNGRCAYSAIAGTLPARCVTAAAGALPARGGTLSGMDLAELQDLMARTYGERDAARGVPAGVAWLCEEIGELAKAARKGSRDEQLHELGDALAWLASIANQLGLS